MSTNSLSRGLRAVVFALSGLAIWTLLPFPASKANDLGYISTCPFAPWSTLALLFIAGVAWAIRQYLLSLK